MISAMIMLRFDAVNAMWADVRRTIFLRDVFGVGKTDAKRPSRSNGRKGQMYSHLEQWVLAAAVSGGGAHAGVAAAGVSGVAAGVGVAAGRVARTAVAGAGWTATFRGAPREKAGASCVAVWSRGA